MFEIAGQVVGWLGEGRQVGTARILDTAGFSSWDAAAAIAATDGQPSVGALFGGSADAEVLAMLADPARWDRQSAAVVTVTVTPAQAADAGLSCGGTARLVLQPATDLAPADWQALADRRARCLLTGLGPDAATSVYTPESANAPGVDPLVRRLFARGATGTTEVEVDGQRQLVTALWPRPTLVVVGDGLIAEALQTLIGLLDWHCTVCNDAASSERAIAELAAGDGVIVLSHDLAVAGPALHAALAGRASYVGALGSRRTQASRADWLTEHGVAAELIAIIHGPAGLDIGALTPYEIAVAIVAELLAVRTGNDARPLRGRQSSIHPTGVQAPPPRYPVH